MYVSQMANKTTDGTMGWSIGALRVVVKALSTPSYSSITEQTCITVFLTEKRVLCLFHIFMQVTLIFQISLPVVIGGCFLTQL